MQSFLKFYFDSPTRYWTILGIAIGFSIFGIVLIIDYRWKLKKQKLGGFKEIGVTLPWLIIAITYLCCLCGKKSNRYVQFIGKVMFNIFGIFSIIIVALGIYGKTVPIIESKNPIEFVRNDDKNKNLIIFIHGFLGNSQETWRKFPKLIEEDHSFDHTNIFSVNYPTSILGPNLYIYDIASSLDDELNRAKIEDYDNVVIIAHSIGGLVARKLIIQRKNHKEKITNIHLLVEIATPHRGVDPSAYFKGLGWSDKIMEEINPESSFLLDLCDDWSGIDQYQRPKSLCIVSGNDGLVSVDSAKFECDSFEDLSEYDHWGHTELVKPENFEDKRYKIPMDEVASILTGPTERIREK